MVAELEASPGQGRRVMVVELEASPGQGRRVEQKDRGKREAYLIQGRWKGMVGWWWVGWKVGEWRPALERPPIWWWWLLLQAVGMAQRW